MIPDPAVIDIEDVNHQADEVTDDGLGSPEPVGRVTDADVDEDDGSPGDETASEDDGSTHDHREGE